MREGGTANLTCKISKGLPKPQLSWLKDGERMDKDAKTTLILTNVTDEDEGEYTCIAQNDGGNFTDNLYFIVQSKYIIIMIILTIKSIRVLFC